MRGMDDPPLPHTRTLHTHRLQGAFFDASGHLCLVTEFMVSHPPGPWRPGTAGLTAAHHAAPTPRPAAARPQEGGSLTANLRGGRVRWHRHGKAVSGGASW